MDSKGSLRSICAARGWFAREIAREETTVAERAINAKEEARFFMMSEGSKNASVEIEVYK